MKVAQFASVEPVSGDVGIEIEVEAKGLPPNRNIPLFWAAKPDPSLRGESMEYILKEPMSIDGAKLAVGQLTSCFEKVGTKILPTYRAGVHVHVNVQDLTTTELVNYICLYLMFENSLINFCDPTRKGNHFCLRAKDASYLIDCIFEFVESGEKKHLDTEDIRYAAMNLNSLFRFGSVEFRALETPRDFNKICVWASVLKTLRDSAKEFANPVKIMESFSAEIFSSWTKRVLKQDYDNFSHLLDQDDMYSSMRDVQVIAYARTWGKKSLNIFVQKNIF